MIVAGGSGTRLGSTVPKQFLSVGGLPILMHTINVFFDVLPSIKIILVLPSEQFVLWNELCKTHAYKREILIAQGGKTRFQSVKNGLALINDHGLVAIHDGVRPFISPKVIVDAFETASSKGSAVVCVNSKDSIRIRTDETLTSSIDRSKIYLVQTPQVFDIEAIKMAYQVKESSDFTDDASVFEHAGGIVHLVEGEYSNIKITTKDDLYMAEAIFEMKARL